jgi:cytochrome c oxidase subunit I+III
MASADAVRLRRVWEPPSILSTIFATVDHKQIAARYVGTAFALFIISGIDGLSMRAQLAKPNQELFTPETFNRIMTMHGTVMIFLFATPLVFGGFGNYLVPLMLGTRDMAFPRLNAFSYWVYLLATIFLYASLILGSAPTGGWFAYTPLTDSVYSPGKNLDFWALTIIFLGISTTAGGVNFIVTIFKLRAPGMTISRIPLFVWGILVTAVAVVFALPPLTVAAALLEAQRQYGFHFYDTAAGGSPLLYQHLFWIFGHPEVYIMLLPAVGIVSSVIPTFSQTRAAGYILLVLSSVSIAFIGFGVWVHHMFATGISPLSLSFFAAAGMLITIPSGVQFFAWIATIWKGRPVWTTSFMFALGFLFILLLGGITGVMVSAVPFDQQVTDTYFIVAHLHYVLVGGVVFPIFAGLYYWLPKITGRMLGESLGHVCFWFTFIGFNVAFFPMHIMGLLGMPRRVYTYQEGLGLDTLNMLSTIGAVIMAIGVLVFVIDVIKSMLVGEPAGRNPWHAGTLEWATESPPEPYNFRDIPVVRSRYPLLDQAEGREAGWDTSLATPEIGREAYGTRPLDAAPQELLVMPAESVLPLALALALLVVVVGILIESLVVSIVALIIALLVIGAWHWPGREEAPA